MTDPQSFRDVMDLWPTKAALARDLTTHGGASKQPPVRDWYRRDHIPDGWFDPVLRAATHRGFDEVTYRLLAGLYKP